MEPIESIQKIGTYVTPFRVLAAVLLIVAASSLEPGLGTDALYSAASFLVLTDVFLSTTLRSRADINVFIQAAVVALGLTMVLTTF